MAARRSTRSAGDTEPAPEVAAEPGFEQDLPDDFEEDEELEPDLTDEEAIEPGEDPTETVLDPDEDDPELSSEGAVVPPPDASFDDDDDRIVAAVTGEEEDAEVEGLRDGEFVCRSCYMAKRDTQLADPEQLLCRDCA